MSNKAQLKILNLCKGLNIAQATYRLELMEEFVARKQLEKRIRLANYKVGD